MTLPEARRAAARQANREQVRRLAAHDLPTEPAELCTRAEINRANAQLSTGPRSPEGKANSSQNSFKHGLYSTQLVLPGENPAELDALRADLRAEHQPFNETEAILVNEMAEQFWRLRRTRSLEIEALSSHEKLESWFATGFLALIQRTMASAERGFHKALTSLRQLQKVRGFVPLKSAEPVAEEIGFVSQNEPTAENEHEAALEDNDSGFVPEDHEPSFKFLRPDEITPEDLNPFRRRAPKKLAA
jgi:hypothetical protein